MGDKLETCNTANSAADAPNPKEEEGEAPPAKKPRLDKTTRNTSEIHKEDNDADKSRYFKKTKMSQRETNSAAEDIQTPAAAADQDGIPNTHGKKKDTGGVSKQKHVFGKITDLAKAEL